MPVEFVVQTNDLRQATSQLKANRGTYTDSDFVDIEVSETFAIFRTVGTESEAPVEGKSLGSVRVPLRIVDKMGEALTSRTAKGLTFRCEPGIIKVGSFSCEHPEIELVRVPSQRLDLPIDLSLIDTLALAKILNPRELAEQGMTKRAEDAHYCRRSIIANALTHLKAIEIEERQLNYFVDCHIQEAAKRLQKSLAGCGKTDPTT